MWAPVNF